MIDKAFEDTFGYPLDVYAIALALSKDARSECIVRECDGNLEGAKLDTVEYVFALELEVASYHRVKTCVKSPCESCAKFLSENL